MNHAATFGLQLSILSDLPLTRYAVNGVTNNAGFKVERL